MNRMDWEEGRTCYLEVAPGVQLRVDVWVKGWTDAGNLDYPPEGEEEMEVEDVSLIAFGKVVDLTDLYKVSASDDLHDMVEEALGLIV